jgi:hypothetical protein
LANRWSPQTFDKIILTVLLIISLKLLIMWSLQRLPPSA